MIISLSFFWLEIVVCHLWINFIFYWIDLFGVIVPWWTTNVFRLDSVKRSHASFVLFCFVLDAGVGKSCLLLRFSDGSFTTSFITTIGFVFWQISSTYISLIFIFYLFDVALTLRSEPLSLMANVSNSRFGTLLVKNASALSPLVSFFPYWFYSESTTKMPAFNFPAVI